MDWTQWGSPPPPPPPCPQLYDQSFPFFNCMCFLLLFSSSPQTSLEPPSMQLLSTTFHFPFDHFPLPVPHISSLLPLFLPPLLPLLPGALCRRCHNRRWNRFICSNVVWAAAWHGAEQHFLPVHGASLALCLQFVCFQTGQSTPLSCTGLSLPLPPTISALSVSVKSHQPSLTQTIISRGKLQWPDTPFFHFHCLPLLSSVTFFVFYIQTGFQSHILAFQQCFVVCIISLILSSPPPPRSYFPSKRSQLLVIFLL